MGALPFAWYDGAVPDLELFEDGAPLETDEVASAPDVSNIPPPVHIIWSGDAMHAIRELLGALVSSYADMPVVLSSSENYVRRLLLPRPSSPHERRSPTPLARTCAWIGTSRAGCVLATAPPARSSDAPLIPVWRNSVSTGRHHREGERSHSCTLDPAEGEGREEPRGGGCTAQRRRRRWLGRERGGEEEEEGTQVGCALGEGGFSFGVNAILGTGFLEAS